MEQYYTYLHCKPNGEPFYVGCGKKYRCFNFEARTEKHKKIVNRHGKKNIGIFVFHCESRNQALQDEKQQISQLFNQGYKLVNLQQTIIALNRLALNVVLGIRRT
jgi:predicted GIY-YIG superfamily endonuclease